MRGLTELARAEKIELLTRTLERRVSILPAVGEIHQSGLTVTVQLTGVHSGESTAREVALAARRRGLAVRVNGRKVILSPPAAISGAELCRMVAVLASSIAEAAVGRMPAAA